MSSPEPEPESINQYFEVNNEEEEETYNNSEPIDVIPLNTSRDIIKSLILIYNFSNNQINNKNESIQSKLRRYNYFIKNLLYYTVLYYKIPTLYLTDTLSQIINLMIFNLKYEKNFKTDIKNYCKLKKIDIDAVIYTIKQNNEYINSVNEEDIEDIFIQFIKNFFFNNFKIYLNQFILYASFLQENEEDFTIENCDKNCIVDILKKMITIIIYYLRPHYDHYVSSNYFYNKVLIQNNIEYLKEHFDMDLVINGVFNYNELYKNCFIFYHDFIETSPDIQKYSQNVLKLINNDYVISQKLEDLFIDKGLHLELQNIKKIFNELIPQLSYELLSKEDENILKLEFNQIKDLIIEKQQMDEEIARLEALLKSLSSP